MQTDFLDAHKRHWNDAEYLFEDGRWANADQLYGLSAECGLKRLMVAFGMTVNPSTGTPSMREDRVHVMETRHRPNTWTRYEVYRTGRNAAAYVLDQDNPFANWDVFQRYARESEFDQMRVGPHKQGADAIRALVTKATLEGFIV